ncbi:DoxX family protein [Aestuariivirga sp.]|uniref:DoxX family protein n=1 Tax=Aestuariivirga sp. TaxID=2650926 RepID=UPI003BAB77C1
MHDMFTVWRRRFVAVRALLAQMPLSLILLGMRISMGFVFFNAGLLKARSFDFAVKLFANEYQLPIIPPEIAARLAMIVELGAPLFLFAGLATRLATLPLIGMTLVIVTLVYPASWVESLLWGSVLVMILTRGPGVISLDHLIERWLVSRDRKAAVLAPAE